MSHTSQTIVAYGVNRTAEQMATLGAPKDKLYVDRAKSPRPERVKLVGDLRGGEVVRVHSLVELGGSGRAGRILKDQIEAKGATVETQEIPGKNGGKGRLRFDPPAHVRQAVQDAWCQVGEAEHARHETVRALLKGARYEHSANRGVLFKWVGKPGYPRADFVTNTDQ